MKLEQIELDLCVNVVPYPHEEMRKLREEIEFLNDLRVGSQEMLLESEGEVIKRKEQLKYQDKEFDEVVSLYLKEASNSKSQEVEISDLKRQIRNYEVNAKGFYGLGVDMNSKLSQERILTNETLMTAQHWKKQYEELLVKHAKVLEGNVKCQNNADIDLDNYSSLLSQHNKLQEENANTNQELKALKGLLTSGDYCGKLWNISK